MALGRWGTGLAGPEGTSSWSRVALRLRFRGDGAPGWMVKGVEAPPRFEVCDLLLWYVVKSTGTGILCEGGYVSLDSMAVDGSGETECSKAGV